MKALTPLAVTLISVLALSPAAEAGPKHHHKLKPGYSVKVLPRSHSVVVLRGTTYYVHAGHFYRHHNGSYVVIRAPVGAVVTALPVGYITFGIGVNRFFYYEGVYYRKAPNGYVVIEKPGDAETVVADKGSDRLIIYPAAGQSKQQKANDKYECHEWAFEETGFDPTNAQTDLVLKPDYQRAMQACLEARDYVVK